jgi:hypothetical protein
VTADQLKIVFGEYLDIWPASIAEDDEGGCRREGDGPCSRFGHGNVGSTRKS